MKLIPAAALLLLALTASAALAQTAVDENPYAGLHYHVAAPEGASWRLECGFRPVTVRGVWYNRIDLTGEGARPGRLPGDNGRCTLWKTGGEGPVGLAIVKDGEARAAGTNDPDEPARVNVF